LTVVSPSFYMCSYDSIAFKSSYGTLLYDLNLASLWQNNRRFERVHVQEPLISRDNVCQSLLLTY